MSDPALKKRKSEAVAEPELEPKTVVVHAEPEPKPGPAPMEVVKTHLDLLRETIKPLMPALKPVELEPRVVVINDKYKAMVPLVNGKIDLDSLLLEGLKEKAPAKDFASLLTLFERGSPEPGAEKIVFRSVLLRAVPGSGKTRAIFEALSVRWGLYLAATISRKNGSAALAVCTTDCELALARVRDGADEDQRFAAVQPFLACLLLSYLLAWEGIKKEHKHLTCYQWLLLQLYPTKFSESGKDFFLDLYEYLRGSVKDSVYGPVPLLKDLVRLLHPDVKDSARFQSFPSLCVIDEAQELLRVDTAFTPYNTSEELMLLPLVVRLLQTDTSLQYIIAGTSTDLRQVVLSCFKPKVKPGAKAAPKPEIKHAEMLQSAKHLTAKPMRDYLSRFFGETVANEILKERKTIAALCGRPRILAGLVQYLLLAWVPGKAVLEQVDAALAKLVDFWEKRVAYIFGTWPEAHQKEKLLICQTLASYYYLNQPLVFYGATAHLAYTGFFDLGMENAPVKEPYGRSRLQIAKDTNDKPDNKETPKYGARKVTMYDMQELGKEPVILQALMNHAFPLFNPLEQIIADDGRKAGYNFESACAMVLVDKLVRDKTVDPKTLENVFKFKDADLVKKIETLDQYKNRTGDSGQSVYPNYWKVQPKFDWTDEADVKLVPDFWKLPFTLYNPGIIGAPLISASSDVLSLSQFLKKPETVFYTPGVHFGADLVFFLQFTPLAGESFKVPVFLQAKLTPSIGVVAEKIEDALLKTDPVVLDATNFLKDHQLEVQKIREALGKDYETRGSIRMVFRVARLPAALSVSPVPRVYLDLAAKGVPRTLVLHLERDRLLDCFDSDVLENALHAINSLKIDDAN